MYMAHCERLQPGGQRGNNTMDKPKLGGAPLASALIVLGAIVFLGGLHFVFQGSVNF